MGTWDVKIESNDTFQDVYRSFFERYNRGEIPTNISLSILQDFSESFDDIDDKNNSLFALALAQWETKSLDTNIFEKVSHIIKSDADIQVWKNLGGDEKILKKRARELDLFLNKLKTEKDKPKRRIRPKFEYKGIKLLTLPSPDGRKTFEVTESYVNNVYQSTSSMMNWNGNGGSIFYFYEKGKFVDAKWLDHETLEITHDKTIEFSTQETTFFYNGDKGIVKYSAK